MDLKKLYPVTIIIMAAMSILLQLVGFVSPGWLIVGKVGMRFGNTETSGKSGLSTENSTNAAPDMGLSNNGDDEDTEAMPENPNKPEGRNRNLIFDNGGVRIPDESLNKPLPGGRRRTQPPDNGDVLIPDENLDSNIKPSRPNISLPEVSGPTRDRTPGSKEKFPFGEGDKVIRPGVKPAKPLIFPPRRPLPEKPRSRLPSDDADEPIPDENDNFRPKLKIKTGKPGLILTESRPILPAPKKPVQPSDKDSPQNSFAERILTKTPSSDFPKKQDLRLRKKQNIPTAEPRLVRKTAAEEMVKPDKSFVETGRPMVRPTGRQGRLLSGKSNWNLYIGLWVSRECADDSTGSTECSQFSFSEGLLLMQTLMKRNTATDVGGTSTWVDLRMESTFALCAGVVGLVGTFLTVKPFCLKGRRKVTLIVGMSGLFLSCILFLVPIIRVASINSALKNSYRDENEALRVQMPWAAVVSGIGACIACVTAGLLAVFTWADEKQIWNKFVDDPPIAFINDVKVNKMDVSGNGEKDGTYDNLATMKNV